MIIKIVDFSKFPGGRSKTDGDHSAQEYYETVFMDEFRKCVERNETLTINLDGTAGISTSFIDELFGRLAYENTLDVVKYLDIVSTEEPYLKDDAWQAMHLWIDHGVHHNSPLAKKHINNIK